MREDTKKFLEAMDRMRHEAGSPTIATKLKRLENEIKPLLKSLSAAVSSADKLDLSQLKPEYAEQSRTEHISKARQAVFNCLKKHISFADSHRGNSLGQLLNHTAYNPPSEALSRMAQESNHREIREAIRRVPIDEAVEGTKLSKRAAFVIEICQGDNKVKALTFLHALSTSPDFLLGEDLLTKLRFDFTRTNSPELYQAKVTADNEYVQVRKMAGLLNAKCIEVLGDIADPISEAERQEVFPPRTAHEQYLGTKRLLAEQREIDQKERNRKLEKSHTLGLSLTAAHQSA